MQARFLSASILVITLAVAGPAAALVPEIPICGHCTADVGADGADAAVGAGNGGIWKTTDGAAATPTTPDRVQTAPSATVPVFLELGGIPGESSETPRSPPPPPPPPPPQNAPTAEAGVQSQGGQTSALIVPAVQRVRESAARPARDGVVVLDTSLPQGGAVRLDPEMPICPHCSADVAAPEAAPQPQQVMPEMPICGHCSSDAQAPAAAAEQPPRRRGGFSVSFGGITVGSGGVSVAAGDVNGDGRGETRSRSERRSDGRR